jgi:hypothetical protein
MKISKKEIDWEEQFDKIVEERGYFGHNVDIEKSFLKKLSNLGGSYAGKLKMLDEYTIRIILPPQMSDARDKTLLLLLTTSPMPTECRFDKKKDQLTVEWHY